LTRQVPVTVWVGSLSDVARIVTVVFPVLVGTRVT
jgi:hypothetical protein